MNSGNLQETSTITIIPLGNTPVVSPHISYTLKHHIDTTLAEGKKVILYYNRRGSARAWVCQDCGHFEKCPRCDIAFAYHTTPKKQLICHHCNETKNFPLVCPHCGGSHIAGVGAGIQQIEAGLKSLYAPLGNDAVVRIDSDNHIHPRDIDPIFSKARILLSTENASPLLYENVGFVGILLFELNMSIPQYDIEEETFLFLSYYKKHKVPLILQTYTPDHPLLQIVLFGNTKDYIDTLAHERRTFLYPPFSFFATIKVHSEDKKKVTDHIAHLLHKIHLVKKDTTFLAYDTTLFEKQRGEWVQKIILKDTTDLSYILGTLEVEIVRNRAITLEWNSL